jgi:hypothetical protein
MNDRNEFKCPKCGRLFNEGIEDEDIIECGCGCVFEYTREIFFDFDIKVIGDWKLEEGWKND